MPMKLPGRLRFVALCLLFAGTASAAHAGDIVITEIMQNPSAVSDTNGEWIEVYNKGSQSVDLNGWTIRDDGSDSHTINGSVVVAPGNYVVLGRNNNSTTNGGVSVAYQYSGINLANGADEVILEDISGTIQDEVWYDGGSQWPDPTGASMALSSASADNNVGANWTISTEAMSSGDLGTPGTGPDAGSGGSGDGIVITEIMQNPSAVSDTNGEWFEVLNTSSQAIDMNGWVIRDDGNDSHTIGASVTVPAGGYAILGRNADSASNGGISVDYEYSGITLGNGADEVVIEDNTGAVIDAIAYDGGAVWPDPAGASMELNDAANDNNDGTNWSVSTNVLSSGDKATPNGGTGGGSGGGNAAPVVSAGANKNLTFASGSASTVLSGTASDADGDSLTIQWSVVSGNASAVLFTDASSASTSVDFTTTGSFTFELSASDGTDTTNDTVLVTVAEPGSSGSYTIYFGNTHAHTEYSDGNKANNPSYNNAANSFRYARDNGGLDWIIMSDHNHATAGMAAADYASGVTEAQTVDAESSSFTALYGMEWGTISTGGHVITVSDNLWGWESGNYDVFIAKGDYNAVFARAVTEGSFIELCHPSTDHFDGIFTSAYNASWDDAISLVAVKSGPAFSTAIDLSDPSNSTYQSRYFDLLLKGYHLGPTGDQDTHYDNWGLANQQRTAVLATDNTRAAILEALSAGRTYATEDRNVQVSYSATVGPNAYGMADSVVVSSGTQVNFDVVLTDPDLESIAEIELMYGTVGGSSVSATSVVTSANSLSFAYTPSSAGTEFFFVRATDAGGQQVWTAPIWLEVTQ